MRKTIILCTFMLIVVSGGARKNKKITPPVMGWSSWNTLALNINEKNICANADAQVSTGLRDAGYIYCNIDDGYMGGRDEHGNLTSNDELFPHGMKYVSEYIRKKGLKPGIYNDAAGNTCGSNGFKNKEFGKGVGFHGHEDADCDLYFNKWDYDFVKVDYCGAQQLGLQEEPTYKAIGDAIKKQSIKLGRKISFNICRWAYPGTWCKNVADSWRISGDVKANWESWKYVIGKNKYLSAYCSDGHYNDMDMLEIGKGRPLNEEEVHMGMWCIQSSPLLVGCDMTKIPEKSLELMKNKELIDINQDPLGLQAYIVYQKDNSFIYVKDIKKLNGKIRVVALLNLGDNSTTFNVPLEIIDMTGKAVTRDLINHKSGPVLDGRISETVTARSIKIWTVKGKRIERSIYNAGTAYMPNFNDLGKTKQTIRYTEDPNALCGVKVTHLGGTPQNVMKWTNIYSKKGGTYDIKVSYASGTDRNLKVVINNDNPILCKNLTTGSFSKYKEFTVRCVLKRGNNTISLGCDDNYAPDIDGIKVIKR